MSRRKKYVQVGLGGRHTGYLNSILFDFPDKCEIVGVCDINEGRLKNDLDYIHSKTGVKLPGYSADGFDKMLKETKPDTVIVTTKDSTHDDYICRAMEAGCDVITEKPMTTDEKKCQRIIDVQRRTGKNCTVAFNYRYSPVRTQVKDILMSGVIGNILSVDFQWMLDLRHGADYFRRWHRRKENSGGLMVHKATHHFDLVNWWLSAIPEAVFAFGHRKFYTPETAERFGLKKRAGRCLECSEKDNCRFYLDLAGNEHLRKRYLDNEKYDAYFRDRCVFSEEIDIEDNMNVLVKYNTGTKLNYSLNAFCPWEGYSVTFNGVAGRLEHKCHETVYINSDGSVPGELREDATYTRIYPHWKSPYNVKLWVGAGGHGGADPVMFKYIFDPENQPPDKYMCAADQRSGAYSILCGIAANISMEKGKLLKINELVQNIGMPNYPVMPGTETALKMPPSEDITYYNINQDVKVK